MLKMHILMRDWQLQARVGIYQHEKESPQFLRLKLELTLVKPPTLDALAETVDYDWLHQTIGELCVAKHYNMLEDLAQAILQVLQQKMHITAVSMTLLKLHAFPDTKPGVKIEWQR